MKSLEKILSVVSLVGALAACGADNGKESCTKDSECKGDRICDSELGYCVDSNGGSSGSSSGSYVHPLIGTWLGINGENNMKYFWSEGNYAHDNNNDSCQRDDHNCFKVTGEYSGTIDIFEPPSTEGWHITFEISGDVLTLRYEEEVYDDHGNIIDYKEITKTYERGKTCPNLVEQYRSCPPPY